MWASVKDSDPLLNHDYIFLLQGCESDGDDDPTDSDSMSRDTLWHTVTLELDPTLV